MNNTIQIHTDGGSRGNPGPAALGVAIGPPINKGYSKFLGTATNNEAEYQAVVFALEKVRALLGKENVKKVTLEFLMDSDLAVHQLSGQWKIEGQTIIPFFIKIWNLRMDFGPITFRHIPREENKEADRLVNLELDKHVGGGDTLFNL